MRKLLWLILCILAVNNTQAQSLSDTSRLQVYEKQVLPTIFLIDFNYGIQLPEGGHKEYFSFNFALGGAVGVLTPSNWLIEFNGEYQFSEVVRKDPLLILREPEGFIIDQRGKLADVQLGQRGYYLGGSIGKLIPVAKYKRSGIMVSFGGGYEQHWIRLRPSSEDILQLEGDYKKGYDHMRSGFALRQFVGYRHIGKRRWLNAFAGFDFTQAFTKSRRTWNFSDQAAPKQNQVDLLFGFRVGISLPFYFHSIESMSSEDVDFYSY